MKIHELFNKLKKTRYSKNSVKKFKSVVSQLETALRRRKSVKNINNITPFEYFLKIKYKKNCVISKYLMTTNYSPKKFAINNPNKKIKLKHCKKGDIIVPVHIRNVKKGKKTKYHFNILVIKNKKVYRIDPSEPCGTKIFEENIKKTLTKYFKKYSFKYCGLHPNSKVIKHGGLCRYVTTLEYVYKNINYNLIKKNILSYFKYLNASRK